ncbi:MAG: hypothetical protein SVU32_07870 [Candidatus Nanohaloarchaea archaeon]|nr:hypothetical protein [Candidatus Nanohaloarchaea archaeon]
MRYFKEDGDELIPPSEAVKIGLDEALDEIQDMPTEDEYATNFIGFERDDTTLQFLRKESDTWLLDVPITDESGYSHSLRQELSTQKVKQTVKRFFNGEDWQDDLDLLKPLEFDD